MAAHLGRLGGAVERTVELTGFSQGPDHVEGRLQHSDGREETMRAA